MLLRRRRLLALAALVFAAPPVVATLVVDGPRGGIAPALACTGFTVIAAVPQAYEQEPTKAASNVRVLLYDAHGVLSKAPSMQDDLRLVQGPSSLDPARTPGPNATPVVPLPFERRELFPGLIELVPRAVEPDKTYVLEWRQGPVGEWRVQSRFHVRAGRDETAPRIGAVGPAETAAESTARSSCDWSAHHLTIPFAVEDESPIVVGVWEGPTAAGKPLGWTAVWNGLLDIDLGDRPDPSLVTFVAFDAAGNRSAPCSLSVSPPAKTSRFGCGKSPAKRETKSCVPA